MAKTDTAERTTYRFSVLLPSHKTGPVCAMLQSRGYFGFKTVDCGHLVDVYVDIHWPSVEPVGNHAKSFALGLSRWADRVLGEPNCCTYGELAS